MDKRDKQPLFMIGTTDSSEPVLIIAVPETAYDDLKQEQSFDFDFTRAGLGLKMMIVKTKDHADSMRLFEAMAKKQGVTLDDRRRNDFSISNGGKP